MHYQSKRRNRSFKRPSIIGALIAAILFGTLGIGAWYVGRPIWNKADASSEWPAVSGVIERSELKMSRSKEGNLLYAHNIEYHYVIDGKKHTNQTVWIGDGYSSSNDDGAKGIVAKYPAGKEVRVYHHPDVKDLAVLEPGRSFSSSWLIYLAIALWCVTATCIFSCFTGVLSLVWKLTAVGLAIAVGARKKVHG